MHKHFKRRIHFLLFVLAFWGFISIISNNKAYAAACTPPSIDYGSVTTNYEITTTATYRIWSRIYTIDPTINKYMLEIDGNDCYEVGGNENIATNDWVWVDYKVGGGSIDKSLNVGNHTIKMIGMNQGLQLDRIIMTSDLSCVPTGLGDNCVNTADTTPPTVSMQAPENGSSVSGSVDITSSVSDSESDIDRVEYYIDGVKIATLTNPPYTYSWDSTTVTNNVHSIYAKAYDTSGNEGQSQTLIISVNNGKPDFEVTTISWTPANPKDGDSVTFSAVIRNNGEKAGPPGTTTFKVGNNTVGTKVDNVSLAIGSSRTQTMTTTWSAVAGSYTVSVLVDSGSPGTSEENENNNTSTIPLVVSSVDRNPPTVSISGPSNNAEVNGNSVLISANASDTGGSGLAKVDFYVDGVFIGGDTTAPSYTFSWDSTTLPDGDHTIYAIAYDAAGLQAQSTSILVKIKNTVVVNKPGDANNDNKVDIYDLHPLAVNWGKSGMTLSQGDFNGDGTINVYDLHILAVNWGK